MSADCQKPNWTNHLAICQPVMFEMLSYMQLGLLLSTCHTLALAIGQNSLVSARERCVELLGKNFTFVSKKSEVHTGYQRHDFTIYSWDGQRLDICTSHPYTMAIGLKFNDQWICTCLSEMDQRVPHSPQNTTRHMPLVLYKAGCKILDEPLARSETKIWSRFLKTDLGKVEHSDRLVDKTRLTLFLCCNLGGYAVSSANHTYLKYEGRILTE